MSQLGDRRKSVRLEVIGHLRATLELNESGRVLDVNDTGALLLSPRPLALDAVHQVRLPSEQGDRLVAARVRHLRQAHGDGGPREYLVGMEFLPEGDPRPSES